MNEKNNINCKSDCPDIIKLADYLEGKLVGTEVRIIELHITECPSCSDAIDGLLVLNKPSEIGEIQNNINKKIDGNENPVKINPVFRKFKYRSIAAAVLILVISGIALLINLFSNFSKNNDKTYVANLVFDESVMESDNEIAETTTQQSQKLIDDTIDLRVQDKDQERTIDKLIIIAEEDSDLRVSDISNLFDNDYENIEKSVVMGSGLTPIDKDISPSLAPTPAEEKEIVVDNKTVSGSVVSESPRREFFVETEAQSQNKIAVSSDRRQSRFRNSELEEIRSDESFVSDVDSSIKISQSNDFAVNSIIEYLDEPEEIATIDFAVVEVKPVFPGGDSDLLRFISTNLNYPENSKANGIHGTVYVTFIIDKKGKVTEVAIAKGVHPSIDNEALRVIKMLPDWKPGMQRGKSVPVRYIIPINFKLY